MLPTYRQESAHLLSPLHFFTHWLPHSWQMKKGRVCEYWAMLGDWLLSQTHE